MTWDESTIAALRQGVQVPARVRFLAADPCRVEVDVDAERVAHGEGADLFEALVAARLELERDEVMLACNGARRDVFPSPMQRQATQGRRAYVLPRERSTQRPPTVDIFAAAPDGADVATVADQRAAYEEWLRR